MPTFEQPQIGRNFAFGAQMADQADDRRARNALLDFQIKKVGREETRTANVEDARRRFASGDQRAAADLQTWNPETWIKLDAARRDEEKRKVDTIGRLMTGLKNAPPDQRQAMWDVARAEMTKSGLNPDDMPPVYHGGYVDWALAKATPIAEQMKAAEAKYMSANGDVLRMPRGPDGKPELVHRAPQRYAPSPLSRLQEERDALDADDPRRADYDRIIEKTTQRGGTGGLTTPQLRTNEEIDQARRTLEGRNLSYQDIQRLTQKQTSTGRDNPQFDPMLESLVRRAARRRYGDDAEYEGVYGRLMTPPNAAPTSAPAPGADGRMVEPNNPQARQMGALRNANPMPLPLNSGRPDPTQLLPGTVYLLPNGQRGRWSGQDFEVVN